MWEITVKGKIKGCYWIRKFVIPTINYHHIEMSSIPFTGLRKGSTRMDNVSMLRSFHVHAHKFIHIHIHMQTTNRNFESIISGVLCLWQVSRAGASNYISHYFMGCNDWSLPLIPSSGTLLLILKFIAWLPGTESMAVENNSLSISYSIWNLCSDFRCLDLKHPLHHSLLSHNTPLY